MCNFSQLLEVIYKKTQACSSLSFYLIFNILIYYFSTYSC